MYRSCHVKMCIFTRMLKHEPWQWIEGQVHDTHLHLAIFPLYKSLYVPAERSGRKLIGFLSPTAKLYKESRYMYKPIQHVGITSSTEQRDEATVWIVKGLSPRITATSLTAFHLPRSPLIQLLLLPYLDPRVQRHPRVILRLLSWLPLTLVRFVPPCKSCYW